MRLLTIASSTSLITASAGGFYYYYNYGSSNNNSNSTSTYFHDHIHHNEKSPKFKDYSAAEDVRDWIKAKEKDHPFVKEVDTFTQSNNPTVDITEYEKNKKLPPTQLQVWRLGTDASTDFPALSKQDLMEEKGFPLYFASDEDEKKHKSSLSQAPVLRLIVYLPKATTARVISESTDPSRRRKWDSQYDEFWILQQFTNNKKSSNKNNSQQQQVISNPWSQFSIGEAESPKCVFDYEKSHKTSESRKEAQTLLSSPEYVNNVLAKRLRIEDGFEIDYVRWTFHRIYSKMTAAFGVKPRLSFMERIYASKKVNGYEDYVIRADVDCSLPFTSGTKQDETKTSSTSQDETLCQKALRLAQKITYEEAKLPRKDDIPVHAHFQELLAFPIPKGTSATKVGELAEAVGKDNLVDLIPWFEKQWLPKVLEEKNTEIDHQDTKSIVPRTSHEGAMMSFTTVNSTGLVGNPRWFERYVHKVFSSHAMGNLMASVHSMEEPPKEHGV